MTPVFDLLVLNGQMEDIFAMSLSEVINQTISNAGTLTLGGYQLPPNKTEQHIHWTPITVQSYYGKQQTNNKQKQKQQTTNNNKQQ